MKGRVYVRHGLKCIQYTGSNTDEIVKAIPALAIIIGDKDTPLHLRANRRADPTDWFVYSTYSTSFTVVTDLIMKEFYTIYPEDNKC